MGLVTAQRLTSVDHSVYSWLVMQRVEIVCQDNESLYLMGSHMLTWQMQNLMMHSADY